MPGDWIKVYRQLAEHDLWRGEPFTRGQAWVDLLMLANWGPGHLRIRGVLIELKRGQLVGSYRYLSERWRWSKGKVERFLDELKNENQIETQTSNITQVITITNYEQYQADDDADEDTNRDANGTQTGHKRDETKKKQEQERRNKKKQIGLDFFPERFRTEEVLSAVNDWSEYYLAKTSKRFTDMELQGRLSEGSRNGWDAERLVAVIRYSMSQGWIRWFGPKREAAKNAPEAERQMSQEEIDAAFERAGNGKGK